MQPPKSDFEMRTSRFTVQGGSARDGIKCNLHPISTDIPLHLHDFYEIELVLEGSMEQTVGGAPLTSRSGDFVFMDLTSTQRIAKPTEAPRVWTFSISPGEADPALTRFLSRGKFPIVGHLPEEKLAEFHRLATALCKTMNESPPYADERVCALMLLLCTLLLEYGHPIDTPVEEPRAYHYIQKVLLFLNENYREPMTLSDIARRIHISPCYLSDLFSRIVGCRFVEYLTNLRLEHARNMLRESENTVTEIAAACGFGTVSNFTRAYRRAFGVPPSAWRRGSDATPVDAE